MCFTTLMPKGCTQSISIGYSHKFKFNTFKFDSPPPPPVCLTWTFLRLSKLTLQSSSFRSAVWSHSWKFLFPFSPSVFARIKTWLNICYCYQRQRKASSFPNYRLGVRSLQFQVVRMLLLGKRVVSTENTRRSRQEACELAKCEKLNANAIIYLMDMVKGHVLVSERSWA